MAGPAPPPSVAATRWAAASSEVLPSEASDALEAKKSGWLGGLFASKTKASSADGPALLEDTVSHRHVDSCSSFDRRRRGRNGPERRSRATRMWCACLRKASAPAPQPAKPSPVKWPRREADAISDCIWVSSLFRTSTVRTKTSLETSSHQPRVGSNGKLCDSESLHDAQGEVEAAHGDSHLRKGGWEVGGCGEECASPLVLQI